MSDVTTSCPKCPKCGNSLSTSGRCYICEFKELPTSFPESPLPPFTDPGIPFPKTPLPAPTGWICPRCGRGNSPYNTTCYCIPNIPDTWVTSNLPPTESL